jgi:hypothetical protein
VAKNFFSTKAQFGGAMRKCNFGSQAKNENLWRENLSGKIQPRKEIEEREEEKFVPSYSAQCYQQRDRITNPNQIPHSHHGQQKI